MMKAVFLDVANTLLHKKDLYEKIHEVLKHHGHHIPSDSIQKNHKLVSEIISFPDKTTADFYNHFNTQFLFSFGIIPNEKLLTDIYQRTRQLPWEPYADTSVLSTIKQPMGILSNWDDTLPEKLKGFFHMDFAWVLASAREGLRKPDKEFYKKIITTTGFLPHEILYIGDSVKLDIEPALSVGLQAVLLDRVDTYHHSSLPRITNLGEVIKYL